MKSIKIILSKQRDTQGVLDALDTLGYTTNQQLAMSNDYLYAFQGGTYIFSDSPISSCEHFPEYSLLELYELMKKQDSNSSINCYRTAIRIHLTGRTVLCKLPHEDSWYNITRYSLLELETGKFQFEIAF